MIYLHPNTDLKWGILVGHSSTIYSLHIYHWKLYLNIADISLSSYHAYWVGIECKVFEAWDQTAFP